MCSFNLEVWAPLTSMKYMRKPLKVFLDFKSWAKHWWKIALITALGRQRNADLSELSPPWSTEQIPGQTPTPHRETQSQKTKMNKQTNKKSTSGQEEIAYG